MNANTQMTVQKDRVVGLLLAVAVCAFYLATLREGQDWGDDFAFYIIHARNLFEGAPYSQTGYILNPCAPLVGPESYPPVFPLLLTVVYRLFGLNLEVMKVEIILIFGAFLYFYWRKLVEVLPVGYRIAIVLAVGLNPIFWQYKDRILTEIPFLFFGATCLSCIHRIYQPDTIERGWIRNSLVVGVLIYLMYATRSVGLVIIPTLLLYEIWKFRRISRVTVSGLAVFGAVFLLQTILFHSDSGYVQALVSRSGPPRSAPYGWLEVVKFHATNFQGNAYAILKFLSEIFYNGYSLKFRLSGFAGVSLLAAYGFRNQIRRNVTVYEMFFCAYFLLFLVAPFSDTRYVIPMIPLFFYYVFRGMQSVETALGPPWGTRVFALLLIFVGVSYAGSYSHKNFGGHLDGVTSPEAQKVFGAIHRLTSPSDVLICSKPRAFALFTHRSASRYCGLENSAGVWGYFKQIRARWLVESPLDTDRWRMFLSAHRENLEEVYGSREFKLYHIRSWPESSP